MSVEASEVLSDVWTRWQGHVINGAFPLGRYLGCSEHSGVFITRSAGRSGEIAIKLVPTNRALAESLLPRWKRAASLAHPHLLRLFEFGGCQLDGLPYLYVVMEYADQTLAQLLLQRALTEDEAREMLSPILNALGLLHARNLVQGQLKPTNILVVGDQLKLASDTIRRVAEGMLSTNTPNVYDPPEARQGSSSTASDIWALGVSLCEALTRRQPSGLGEPREPVLPADFSPAFRDVVARCLSPAAEHRPNVTEVVNWVGGRSAPVIESAPVMESAPTIESAVTGQSAALVTPDPGTPAMAGTPVPGTAEPRASAPATSETKPPERKTPEPAPRENALPPAASPARPASGGAQPLKPRALLTVVLGAVAIVVLVWTFVRVSSSHRAPAPPPPAAQAVDASLPQTAGAAAPAAEPRTALSAAGAARSGTTNSPSALREVVPDVPLSARRTLRGHIKVWVRVIVDQDGSVFAATADRPGPSAYFHRLALESAKKWTFPPADTPSRRIMQVRFDFGREGTTARAVTLH